MHIQLLNEEQVLMKNTSISIRMDSGLKEQAETILEQLGLNMTTVVNMLFCQIVRDRAIPLSLSLKPKDNILEELMIAKNERISGQAGRLASSVIHDMERIIADSKHGQI